MLQQTAEPGVMELLGGGGFDKGFADNWVCQNGGDKALKIGVGESGDGPYKLLPELGDIVRRCRKQVGAAEFRCGHRAQSLDFQL